MKPWSLYVKLESGLVVQNPDIRCYDMDWGSGLYSSGIEFIRFAIPGRIFTLAYYEKYNYFLEVTQDALALRCGGLTKLEAIYICGAYQGKVDILRLTKGGIQISRKPFGREYGGTASRGWQLGIHGKQPKFLQERIDGDNTFSLQS